MFTTRQTTMAAISIGVPSLSFTLLGIRRVRAAWVTTPWAVLRLRSLRLPGLERLHPQGHPLGRVERVAVVEPLLLQGADVLAEQLDDAGLVRVDDHEPGQPDEPDDEDQHGHQSVRKEVVFPDGQDDQARHRGRQQEQEHDDERPAGREFEQFLVHGQPREISM